jgi:hypothetical protein
MSYEYLSDPRVGVSIGFTDSKPFFFTNGTLPTRLSFFNPSLGKNFPFSLLRK